jgi:hypothetical protein
MCYVTDSKELVTWQEAVENETASQWRTVDSEAEPVRVTLDANAFNSGAIVQADGQGFYDSREDLKDTMSKLLGLPKNTDVFDIVIKGETVKISPEGEVLDSSTGDFLFDALSSPSGKIIVDGEDQTESLFPADGADDSTIEYDENYNPGALVVANDWTAEHSAFVRSGFIIKNSGSVTKDIKLNGQRCKWVWI